MKKSLVKKLTTLALVGTMTVGMAVNAFAATTEKFKDENTYALGSKGADKSEANPFKGETPDQFKIEYTFNSTQAQAAWRVHMVFVKGTADTTTSVLEVAIWPHLYLDADNNADTDNDNARLGTGHAGPGDGYSAGNILADPVDSAANKSDVCVVDGNDHTFTWYVSKTAVTLKVDGKEVKVESSLGTDYADEKAAAAAIYDFISTADLFEIGGRDGIADKGWYSENECELKSVVLSNVVGTDDAVSKPADTSKAPVKTSDAFTFVPVVVLALAALAVVVAKKRTVEE